MEKKYDFFIAYPRQKEAIAEELYAALVENDSQVFFDKKHSNPGLQFGPELIAQQESSLITVAIITKETNTAFFQTEEIFRAQALQRKNADQHRVIPIYFESSPHDLSSVPYGLSQVYHMFLDNNLQGVVSELIGLAWEMQNAESTLPTSSIEKFADLKHPLEAYPVGPFVPKHYIPRSLVYSFMSAIKPIEATDVVGQANRAIDDLKTNDQFKPEIRIGALPPPLTNSAVYFWFETFYEAASKGPRMLASLVLTVPDDLFTPQAKQERKELLTKLLNYAPNS